MKHLAKQQFVSLLAIIFLLFTTGCLKDEFNKQEQPEKPDVNIPEDLKDFGFNMNSDITLSVNYDAPGLKAKIEVYAEYPIEDSSNLKKENLKPVFTAFTDNNGKYEGKMYIPTAIKEAYLYTPNWGVQQCVKLESVDKGFVYDATKLSKTATTKASDDYTMYFQGNIPYDLRNGPNTNPYREDNLYSICKWRSHGTLESTYVSSLSTVKGESVYDIAERVKTAFDTYEGNKKDFLRDASVVNIVIPKGGTNLKLTFLTERAAFKNTVGYYYYPKNKAPYDYWDLKEIKRYIAFPNASFEDNVLKCGYTVDLKYFGPDGTSAPSDIFPEDYVVGWFYVSNGFSYSDNIIWEGGLSGNYNRQGSMPCSDDTKDFRRFVSFDDKKTGLLVIGFEDQLKPNNDEDYSDVLFFVSSNADISNNERPAVPGEKPELIGNNYSSGTLGFEDIWPSGGDYDLNDVAVEYDRNITYNGNNIATSVTESFRFVHKLGSASFNNYFAYQVSDLGNPTSPEGIITENETKSIILNAVTKNAIDSTFTVTRTLSGTQSQTDVVKDFNPYIIVSVNEPTSSNRKEVHLPNQNVTSKADKTFISKDEDAYYMNKSGLYPFAINIPTIGFRLSPERKPISESYPHYLEWAKSYGKNNQDWYLK